MNTVRVSMVAVWVGETIHLVDDVRTTVVSWRIALHTIRRMISSHPAVYIDVVELLGNIVIIYGGDVSSKLEGLPPAKVAPTGMAPNVWIYTFTKDPNERASEGLGGLGMITPVVLALCMSAPEVCSP